MPGDEGSNYPSGSVVRIKLTNFLTYDSVEVKPAPGLNLLLGPNGTGKSTMVCALCLGLAGSPAILGRSTKLPDYVKHGKHVATIEIELSAGGERKNPVIKTTIRRNASPQSDYCVDDKKKTKEEVREFVRKYHIQVDNLCQFLAQDKVVEFARQTKQDLLINTEKAAGNVDLYEQHMLLKDRFNQGSELRRQLDDIAEKKTLLEQKLAALEAPFRQYQEYQKRKEKLELLEKKRPLLEYELVKEEAEALKAHLDRCQAEYRQREAHLKPWQDKIAEATTKSRQLTKDLADQKKSINQAKHRIIGDTEALRRLSNEMDDIKHSIQTAKEDYDNKVKKIQAIETAIKKLYQELEGVNEEEDMGPQIQLKDQELRTTSTELEQLEARHNDVDAKLRQEQAEKARLVTQLNNLANRQQQKLQFLRQMDRGAYEAYVWLTNNREQFRGAIWMPAMDMRIPDKGNIKFIESCVSRRDLFSLVFESFPEMQRCLDELKRQNIRVATGMVPQDQVNINPRLSDDLKRLGFRDYVCNMFEAPDGLKKYMTKLFSLNQIPVGTDATENNLQRVSDTVKGRFKKFLTPNKMLTITNSRYGGAPTIKNEFLRDPLILGGTTGTGDESVEQNLRQQHSEKEVQVQRLQTTCGQLGKAITDLKRARDVLLNEKHQLRQRAGQRAAINQQINLKQQGLEQQKRLLPDLSREEVRAQEQLQAKVEEKLAVYRRAIEYMKTIETRCDQKIKTGLARKACTTIYTTYQKKVKEASLKIRDEKAQLDRLTIDYSEKKANARAFLQRLRQALGSDQLNQQLVPDEFREAFKNLPDNLEDLDEQLEEQRALLEQSGGGDKTVAQDYMKRRADLDQTITFETHTQQAFVAWETDVGALREKWLAELHRLMETISRNFSRFMRILDCAGEVELDQPENINDFIKYGVKIKVKFRDNEPLRELDPNHQSGGERSVSTMLYMLALQELSHVPFRCVDEINQGMDPKNERKVFEMMTKLLSGEGGVMNCTQYFMLTPKLLRGLPMGENIEVWLIHNGRNMLANEEWSAKKFMKRMQASKHLMNGVA